MTQKDIMNIASKLDDETKKQIDLKAEELLEILKNGELDEDEMKQMENCIYSSLIIQEYLDGEYDLLEEDRQELLDQMEEMYNEYGDLLIKARLEEKVNKKKKMTLLLMQIRDQLFGKKEFYKSITNKIKENRESKKGFEMKTSKDKMKDLVNKNKKFKENNKLNNLEETIKKTNAILNSEIKKVNKDNNLSNQHKESPLNNYINDIKKMEDQLKQQPIDVNGRTYNNTNPENDITKAIENANRNQKNLNIRNL